MRSQPAASLIGHSPEINRLRMAFERLAACDSTVLISGESGTGKESSHGMIHRRSRRHAGPLIAVSGVALVGVC